MNFLFSIITAWVTVGASCACLWLDFCGYEKPHIEPQPVDFTAMRILSNPPLYAAASGPPGRVIFEVVSNSRSINTTIEFDSNKVSISPYCTGSSEDLSNTSDWQFWGDCNFIISL
jgi:hypothetical protein